MSQMLHCQFELDPGTWGAGRGGEFWKPEILENA